MSMTMRAGAAILAGTTVAAAAVGCSSSDKSGKGDKTTIRVLAAASLSKTFDQLKHDFESKHDGVTVDIDYAGSSALAEQIVAGNDADVFASADEQTMGRVTKAGDAKGTPAIFATNTLTIATPPGNPAHITGFADLAKSGVKVAVCAAPVPCGAAEKALETKTGVKLHPVTEEDNVTAVLTKVTSDQVDAGVVYVTDVKALGSKVTAVDVPQASSIINKYPITVLKGSKHQPDAAAFVALVRSAAGQEVLRNAGFGAP